MIDPPHNEWVWRAGRGYGRRPTMRRAACLVLAIGAAGCGGQSGAGGSTTDAGAHASDATTAPDGGSSSDATAGFDAPVGDSSAGDGGIGAPCNSDDQCAGGGPGTVPGGLCLGLPFTAGYCTVRIPECPASPDGG